MEESKTNEKYEGRRKDWLASTITFFLQGLECHYDIDYHNPERLLELKDEGFILLPKHQRMLDIMLEGLMLREVLHKNGSYIMKSTLPGLMEYLGGIPIKRAKDILLRSDDREIRKREIEEAREIRDRAENMVAGLIAHKEIIVFHPEGTRNYKARGDIPQPNLDSLIRIQKKVGYQIPFVPLDIDYKTESVFDPEVDLIVGRPIRTSSADELRAHLSREIKLLH